MESATLFRLEQQAAYFQKFSISNFIKEIDEGTKDVINIALEDCRKKCYDLARDDDQLDTKIVDQHLKQIHEEYLENFENSIAKVKNKLEEVMYIPFIDIYGAYAKCYDEVENKYQSMKTEHHEKKILIAELKRELKDYEALEDVFVAVENILAEIEDMPGMEVPEYIKTQIVNLISLDSSLAYKIVQNI